MHLDFFPIFGVIQTAAAAALAALGVITGSFGAWGKANAAKLAQKRLLNAANLPGVDIGTSTNESLDNMIGNMDKSAQVARLSTLADKENFDQLLDAEIPGYRKIQDKRSAITQSMLAGELPPDVVSQINRQAAARATTGGYGGSGFHEALTLRDFGDETRKQQALGMSYAENLIRSTPISPLTRTSSYFGPNPVQTTMLRADERKAQQDLLAKYANMPGGTSVWGNYLSGLGGMMTGAGLAGLTGGVGGLLGGNNSGGSGSTVNVNSGGGGFSWDKATSSDPGWAWAGSGYSSAGQMGAASEFGTAYRPY